MPATVFALCNTVETECPIKMSLRYIMLLQKDVPKAARFYSEGLGLQLRVLTERWAELESGGTTIALKAADSQAYCSTGYSPILSFNVGDLQETLTKLLHLGAEMDGAIQYPAQAKVVAVRAPDGHMISLIEPAE